MMESRKDLGLLILRLLAGGFMLSHGVPKLMSLFSDGPIQFADPVGIGMTTSLILAVFSEFICSILIVIGFQTRLASLALAVTMFIAGFIVHASDPWKAKEKALLYFAMYLALIFTGPGKFSIDKR